MPRTLAATNRVASIRRLQPIFEVSDVFGPESIDAFEIGSKNSFLNDTLQFNATAFFYKYSDLQLSRIIARTSVNDTIDANIWGLEFETIIRPSPNWLFNMNVSYLNAEVAGDQFFSNPRDPGGGDPDAVIIKDITNGANCAVTGAGADGFVAAVNAGLGLQGPTEFPADGGIASSGAFSICEVLAAQSANPALIDLFGSVSVLSPGVEVNLRGNKLPQAPEAKASFGAQYTYEFAGGATLGAALRHRLYRRAVRQRLQRQRQSHCTLRAGQCADAVQHLGRALCTCEASCRTFSTARRRPDCT